MTEQVPVGLGARSYTITISADGLARAGEVLKPHVGAGGLVVVTDDNLIHSQLPALEAGLAAAGLAWARIVLPAGERTKDFSHLQHLCERLLAQRVERSTLVVALGGGVLGDLAGFAAAVTLRGLPLVQVPTTLLAQVDSAVGGKTGINTSYGKNLVGAFYQPQAVLSDIAALDTLPKRELLAGYAEVVKYALIDRPAFFAWLEEHGAALIGGDRAAREAAVAESCRAKAAIVAADETERSGRRALLNLGHTFAHAIEAEAGYRGTVLHGEAVAVGLYLAHAYAARLGLCPVSDATRVRAHLLEVGLPATLADLPAPFGGWRPDRLTTHMTSDKKTAGGQVRFILSRGIGQAFLSDGVDLADVELFLADARAG